MSSPLGEPDLGPSFAPCARQQSKHRDVMGRTGTDLNYAAVLRAARHRRLKRSSSELQSAFAECRRLTSRGAKGLSAAGTWGGPGVRPGLLAFRGRGLIVKRRGERLQSCTKTSVVLGRDSVKCKCKC
jgi:hypothetical protein